MRKVTLLLLALMVVLTSCGPVTAVPSVTETPFQAPTPVPVTASSFRLREMSESGFISLINTYVVEEELRSALFKEALLKFPESEYKFKLLGNILAYAPETRHVPGINAQEDVMSWMITRMLESGVPLEDLEIEIEKSELGLYESLSMKNLMGSGEDDLILRINTCKGECKMGIWVVFRDGENYRVEKMRDWGYSNWPQIDYQVFDVGDTNGNGFSELTVLRSEKSGGSMYVALDDFLDHFEWSGVDGMFQRTRFPLISQQCMLLDEIGAKPKSNIGPCSYDWKFINNGSQNSLISYSVWYTQFGCPDLTVQRASVWDGERYILGKAEILPPDGNLTSECQLAWADTAISLAEWAEQNLQQPGWENDQAISIIEQSLEDWPSKADEWWGSASRDYFRLKLGIWRELRGEQDQAISLIKQAATRPHNSEFDYASRLAILYLQERKTEGKVRACDVVDQALYQELFKVISSPLTLNSPSNASKSLKAMKNAWGFVPMDITGLCHSLFMLQAEAKNHHLTSAVTFNDWLKTLSYPIYQNTAIDLNIDGVEDRLVYLETSDQGDLDGWAFFMTDDGYVAKYFDYSVTQDNGSENTIIPLEISDEIKAFMFPSDDSFSIAVLKPDFHVDTDAYFYQPSVQSNKVISQTQPVQIMADVMNRYERKTLIFSWNDISQSFVEQNSIDYVVSQIEKVLYVDQDYLSVINRVDTLLANSNFESDVATLCGISVADDFCVDFPEEYAAYFLYMRALSFEQMGLVNDARDAYYQLWQKYPQNLFGIIASKKLEPVQP
ncbi:MAG: hypothetical protein HY867_16880 [Chloroflexi bacterium]|nr:hypothetical protein [Chloroflexota bacterium]